MSQQTYTFMLESLEDLLSLLESQSNHKSNQVRQILRARKVRDLQFNDLILSAEVRDNISGNHHPSIDLDEDPSEVQYMLDCTCSSYGICRHLGALIMLYIYGLNKYAGLRDKKIDKMLAGVWQTKSQRPDRAFYANLMGYYEAVREGLEEYNRPIGDWWIDFLKSSSYEERRLILIKAIEHGAQIGTGYDFEIGNHVKWLLRHTNPINALRDLLAGRTRYIDDYRSYYFTGPRFIEKIKAFKDEGLAAFLESDLCRDAERDMGDMILASHFKAWFQEENRPQPNAQIEIFFSVGDEKPCPFLYWELVLSTTRLYQSPRHAKAIESLDREVKDGKRVLPDMEERLLRWVSSLPEITDNHSSNNSTTFAVGHIARWLMDWEEFDLIRWRDKKEPVRIDWEPANLYPAPLDSGALEWRLRKPDGSSLPLAEAEIILDGYIMPGTEDKLRTSIYFLEGPTLRPVHTKHMPLTLLQDLKNIGVFSPSAIESPQVTRKLIRHYKLDQQAEFADSKLICHVPAKPQVEIRLTSNSSITVTARAETATGQTFYRDSRGNWLQVAKIEPVGGSMQIDLFDEEVSPELNKTLPLGSEDAEEPDFLGKMPPEKQQRESLLVEPAPECIQAVDEFLESFLKGKAIRTKDDQGYPQLEWDYSQKQLPDLLDSWARRPKSITYLGNRAFQNLLITCKPPRISLSVTESGTDWLRVSVKMEREMEALSMAEVRQALQTSQSDLVILKGNRVYRKEELEQYESTVNRLSELGLDPEGDEQKMHALQLAFAAEDASHELAGMPEDLSLFRERATEIIQNFTGVPPAVLPEKLQSVLRPYQKEGVSFLAWAWENFGGAILADDMGLGKTLQVLTALSSIQSSEDEKLPSLIICPTSVTHNWLREAKNFTPWLSAVVLERGENRKRVLKNLTKWDIVITNYALARRESENLTGQEWRLVCVDEAQAIKNPAANISALVKSLEARFRVALTGTPIENRLTDLWSIADFAVPNYLWTRRSFEKRAKEWDDALLFKNLRARLRPLLMRRLKTEVAKELPPRIEERRDCEMAAGQRKAYLAELKQAREMLKDKDTKLAGKERIIFLAVLTRMRQICCDPALLNLSARKSGKVDAALELLEELLEAGHKVLLFSQFVRMLERLEIHIKKKKWSYWMLTGKTTQRQKLVEEFEASQEPGIFLISLKAGGSGLNLVSASHVILFDPWWNPAVEAQAIDRTHRIGQDKTVVAYRLVTTDTVEERILELQEKKMDLVKNVLEEDAFNRALSTDDLKYLVELDD